MGEFPWWFHITWTSALQLVLSIGVLFGVVGIGALPGLVPLLIFISAVVFLGCSVSKSAPLNAETIFTVLATLRNMGDPVIMIPEALCIMIQV
ncbi:ABC transporter C family, partial [Trifolium medium]|nr:ABC transporter C family [Trifolium medium]